MGYAWVPRNPAEPFNFLLICLKKIFFSYNYGACTVGRFRTVDVLVSAPPALTALPPEVVLHVLSYLDAESLCAAARSCRALRAVSSEASLWRRLGLTLGALPWPPSRPRALHTLRVCSYHCPSSERAQRALAWLAGGASEGAPLPVRRLELVGRHLDADTVRASMQLCTTACELVLRDVHVQAEWLPALAAFDNLAAVLLDWHTVSGGSGTSHEEKSGSVHSQSQSRIFHAFLPGCPKRFLGSYDQAISIRSEPDAL